MGKLLSQRKEERKKTTDYSKEQVWLEEQKTTCTNIRVFK